MVDVAEDGVAETGAVDGVLSSQRDAAGTDDDDDQSIESTRRHQVMDVATYTAKTTYIIVGHGSGRVGSTWVTKFSVLGGSG